MRKVKLLTIKNGIVYFHLASNVASDDWICSARLSKEGKTEELQKLNEKSMYYLDKNFLREHKEKMELWNHAQQE